ncbi:MAG: class I SAM-dependent methyltransferase, partial [Anaerolineaceae bacterium]
THLAPVLPLVDKLTALDISPSEAARLSERFKPYGSIRAVTADFMEQPLPGWMKITVYDTVLCLNLLEHVPDDLQALRRMNALLPASQGVLILQVPAHPGLYGSLDKQARHFRRYRKAELAVKLEQTGFKVLHLEYFNRLGAIFWWLNARILKTRRYSRLFTLQV